MQIVLDSRKGVVYNGFESEATMKITISTDEGTVAEQIRVSTRDLKNQLSRGSVCLDVLDALRRAQRIQAQEEKETVSKENS